MLYSAERVDYQRIDRRLFFLSLAIILLFCGMVARLFVVQVLKHEYYNDLAARQQLVNTTIQAARGEILARDHTNSETPDLYPLAANKIFYEVYVDPSEITRPQNTAEALASALGLEDDELIPRVEKQNDRYEPIKHKVTEQELELIKKIDLPGIYWRQEVWRYYPDGANGSHILGFFGYQADEKVGKYGIEGYWENILAGESVEAVLSRTAKGSVLAAEPTEDQFQAVDGSNIILTIDRTIQHESCQALDRAVAQYDAESGSVIVMEPETGRILAMCSAPGFDPNNYQQVENVSNFNDHAVYGTFEPGSVFKAFSMAAAIDDGKVTPATTYEDEGFVKFGDFEVKNSDLIAHGTQTMTQVLEKSLNTGMIFATHNMRNKVFKNYVEAFGFGQKYDIGLEQVSVGDISSLDKSGDIHKATASYGQGITATTLQLAVAANSLANDGRLMKPYIVEEVVNPLGKSTKTEPEVLRQVIRPETANQVQAMLVSVVDNGHGTKAAVDGYYIAGKTGTAQIAERGKYTNQTVQSFIGFGPVSNPKFTIVTTLYKPTAVSYAADSAAPMFGEIAQFLVNYYQIPPER